MSVASLGFRNRYLEYLIDRHRSTDRTGLAAWGMCAPDWECIAVEVSVAPRQTDPDALRTLPERVRVGRHALWEFLETQGKAGPKLVLTGPPGCGKTTLLVQMALTVAAGRGRPTRSDAPRCPTRRRLWARIGVGRRPGLTPILLSLNDLGARVTASEADKGYSLPDMVRDGLARWGGPKPPRGWFEHRLDGGRCLVLLDGLDEVADAEARWRVGQWVEGQMALYAGNRFVIVSRTTGYRASPLSGVAVLEVQPLTRKQVEQFVRDCYLAEVNRPATGAPGRHEAVHQTDAHADDPCTRVAAQAGAEDLLWRIWSAPESPALAANPRYLAMMAIVHRGNGELQGRSLPQQREASPRAALYAAVWEVLFGEGRAACGPGHDLTPGQAARTLQPLAYHMMCEGRYQVSPEETLEILAGPLKEVAPQCEGRAFLGALAECRRVLEKQRNGLYRFVSRGLLEYLAARHVAEQRLAGDLIERVGESWWQETIRLYAGQADATPIARACLAEDPPTALALALAADCLEEAREIEPQARARLERALERSAEDRDPERRQIAAEALLARRLRRLARQRNVESGVERQADDGLISHAEYQLWLDERGAEGAYRQPDHWPGLLFSWGQGQAPVVGVRYRDAADFCRWLTERDGGGWRYRLLHADERDLAGVPRSVQSELPSGAGYWVTAAGGEGQHVLANTQERASLRLVGPGSADLAAWIGRDLAVGRDLLAESALTGVQDLASALGLDPDLDRAHARELANDLADVLGRDLDRARTLDPALADALAGAIAGANRVDYGLDGAGARDLGEVVAQAHDVDRALAVAHYRAHAIPRARALARTTARASSLARDLTIGVARAGASDVARMLLLTGNRSSAIDRAHALAQAIARDLDHGVARDRSVARDVASDLDHAHTLSRASDLDLSLALARARDIARPLDLDRVRGAPVAAAVAHGVGDLVAREIARVRAIVDDPDLDHIRAHTLDRARARALERALTGDLGLARALARSSELARARAAAHAGALPIAADLDFARALDVLIDRGLYARPESERKELSADLRRSIRLEALARAIEFGAMLQAPDLFVGRQGGAQGADLEERREAALDVYIQFSILEDRIDGHLPAWEGVRIVREWGATKGRMGLWGSSDSRTRRDSRG